MVPADIILTGNVFFEDNNLMVPAKVGRADSDREKSGIPPLKGDEDGVLTSLA
jgi:hypothetical protein